MKVTEKILKMYYIDKMKQKDIANKLQVSKYKVSRTVTKDERYNAEKERRKTLNANKNKKETIRYIKNKRKNNSIDYYVMKAQHDQAVGELSKRNRTINNKVYKKWNSSIYEYDKKSNSFILKKGINVGYDVPRKILWK